jgi:hypothetical protein
MIYNANQIIKSTLKAAMRGSMSDENDTVKLIRALCLWLRWIDSAIVRVAWACFYV